MVNDTICEVGKVLINGAKIAEVELDSEDEVFLKPDWLGKEVTGQLKYYNSMLMKNPFKNWK